MGEEERWRSHRCPGRRAGNEIQSQLECSGDNSCFWDSVARCQAVENISAPGGPQDPSGMGHHDLALTIAQTGLGPA